MRESQTVRCPKCGGALDAYVFIKAIHMDSDLGPVGSIVIEWQDSVVEGHECRFQFDDIADEVDSPAGMWDDAGSGVLKARAVSRGGRPIVDVQLPAFP